jgi:hypothetical protein
MAAARNPLLHGVMLWWRWLRRHAIRRGMQQLRLDDEQIYFAPF